MKRFLLLLVLCFAPMLTSGCDLFSTRAPEPPNTGNTFIWTPATTVDYLLTNFVGTLQMIDASNYARVFVSATDSASGSKIYTFSPAPGLDQSSRSIFSGWNVQSEQLYLAKLKTLLTANSQLTVLLSNEVVDQNSTTASVTADYTISLPVDPSSTVLPSVVQGSLQLQLELVTTEQGTKEWRILNWSDFPARDKAMSSWTDLKIKLSS